MWLDVPRKLFAFVVVVVTVVWATVWIASVITGRAAPDQSFNLVMGAIVGSAGGFGFMGRKRDRKDSDG